MLARRWFFALLSLLVLAGVAGAAQKSEPGTGNAPAQAPIDGGNPEGAKNTIFDFKSELGLTDAQVDAIKQKIAGIEKKSRLAKAKITILNEEIQDLNAKNGDFETLKKKITEAYGVVAELKIDDIQANREINAILKPAQLEKWQKIQKENRRQP